MKVIGTLAFLVIVAALFAQSLSLALHPRTLNSTAAYLNPNAHYGTREQGSEPLGDSTRTETLWIFLIHGIRVSLDALSPFRTAVQGSGEPMSRTAWEDSPYHRPDLPFDHWSKTKSAWEARRYDRILDHRYEAAWHPLAAGWGYWLGRLVFLWAALGVGAAWGIFVGVRRIQRASSV